MKAGIKNLFVFLFSTLSFQFSMAQHQELNERPHIWRGHKKAVSDTNSLLHAFKNGSSHGHFRYYFMATDNASNFPDFYANAAGGGLRFETGKFYGFQVGISGFFIFDVGSGPMVQSIDGEQKVISRYELGLFDVDNPRNRNDIDRLEELFIKYNFGDHSHVEFGKILVNTPFMNLQDGRMRPSGVRGAWFYYSEMKKMKFEGGFLNAFSPRSTVEWYRGAEFMGVYPQGVDVYGRAANYRHNLKSLGVAVIGVNHQLLPKLKYQFWNYYFDNIINTSMLQLDFVNQPTKENTFFSTAQLSRQYALNYGGNEDINKTYAPKGHTATSIGIRLGYKSKNWEHSLNYNRITAEGRFLNPREWGREPFMAFLPRERSEGMGDVHSFMGITKYQASEIPFSASLGVGVNRLPDPMNYRLNKYGIPSYTQLNLDVRYELGNLLDGLETQLLIASKFNNGNTYNNPEFIINRVNMTVYNFVVNYHF